jgi:hypothetical protein
MSEYSSNRQRKLNIGINSYTENELVLNVIGNTNITGITTLASSGGITTTGGDLYVGGNLYIKNAAFPTKLSDLLDVQINDNLDKYVLMYDRTIQKWRNVNPDEVLITATTDQTPGYVGLPTNFEDQLITDLNSKIDLDAGTF